jgi:LAO/AO transport system kinase
LQSLLALAPAGSRRPPILKTTAIRGEGLDKVADAIADHRNWLESSGELARHRARNARHSVLGTTRAILLQRIQANTPESELNALVERVANRELDPHTAAEELANYVRG